MYKNYRIVVVTPSGRQKYQSLLFKYIKNNFDIIDEYRIWLNTKNKEDIFWLQNIKNKKVTIDSRENVNDIKTICQYFDNCIDHNTIYIRLDDDIVYLEKLFFQKLIDFRINNPDFLFVSANIINNHFCFNVQKKLGLINFIDNLLDPKQAEKLHNYFIDLVYKNKIEKMFFDKEIASNYEQININAICWFGKHLDKNYKIIKKNKIIYKKSLVQFICENEEMNITNVLPKITKKYNCVCGDAVCSHFSFRQQIDYLKNTDLLKKYKNLLIKIH